MDPYPRSPIAVRSVTRSFSPFPGPDLNSRHRRRRRRRRPLSTLVGSNERWASARLSPSMVLSLPIRLGSSALGIGRATVRLRERSMGSCPAMAAINPGSGENTGRGSLIVLEGLDRSGKSSQCARLATYLEAQGVAVEAWRFPDRTTAMGRMISSYLSCQTDLDDAAIHLLFSANRWEKCSLMESKLRAGTTLVIDRYSYSGVAFSVAKGLDLDWCKGPEAGLPAPDLVLYLDISAEVAAARGGYGGERYEKLEFQKKVEKVFKSLKDTTWQCVDATQSMDSIQSVLREESVKVINECLSGRQLMQMWLSKDKFLNED